MFINAFSSINLDRTKLNSDRNIVLNAPKNISISGSLLAFNSVVIDKFNTLTFKSFASVTAKQDILIGSKLSKSEPIPTFISIVPDYRVNFEPGEQIFLSKNISTTDATNSTTLTFLGALPGASLSMINVNAGSGVVAFENNVNFRVGLRGIALHQVAPSRRIYRWGMVIDLASIYKPESDGFQFVSGKLFLATTDQISVHLPGDTALEIPKGAILEMEVLGEEWRVRYFYSQNWKSCSVISNSRKYDLTPGEQLCRGSVYEDIPIRLERFDSKNGIRICEFSIVHALSHDYLIRYLTTQKSLRCLLNKISKTEAILSIVNYKRGPFVINSNYRNSSI